MKWGKTMKKINIAIIILLTFFFISLGSVTAVENNTIITAENPIIACEEEAILSAKENRDDEILSNSNEITVNEGDSIQKAIDDAIEGSTIIVNAGNYTEDLVVSKGLTIIGKDANLNSDKTAFNILSTANYTSVSGFNIHVTNSNGTGILINSSNCKITDNKITGGNRGIFSDFHISNSSGQIDIYALNNLWVLGNTISNVGESGISVKAYNPTVSRNRVTNVINTKENGTATGIEVNGIGVIAEDLTVIATDNHVSNVKSINDTAYGISIGGNSIFDTLVGFDVSGNVVKNILGVVESYGANIGIFSLNTTLPTVKVSDLDISHISTGAHENSTAIGLSVSVTTIGQNETSDTYIENVNVTNLKASGANSKAKGIDATGVGHVDIYVSNNNINRIKASKLITGIGATGIEYNKFKAFISVSNNNITNFDSPKINGINVMSLGNAKISKNLLQNLPGKGTTFITGVTLSFSMENMNVTIPENATIEEIMEILKNFGNTFNSTNFTIDGNLSVIGNNLEGTGVETGFAIVRPSQIHYNRAVNLKYNVIKDSTRQFILESYDYDPNMSSEELAYILLKSQEAFENCTEEELRNMSASLGAFLDNMFGNFNRLTAGNVNAKYNWWGSNSKPSASKFKNNNGTVKYDPWLILRVKSSPSVINKGEYSKITADVYKDSKGNDHSSKASLFFSGPKITLSTDIGSFNNKKSITLNWTNGKVTAYLKGDESGLATVTASDYESANTTVLILGESDDEITPTAEKTNNNNAMPAAGNPIVLLLIAVLMICPISVKKKK